MLEIKVNQYNASSEVFNSTAAEPLYGVLLTAAVDMLPLET